MRITVTEKNDLAQLLKLAGHVPDLRCGGRGTCGRCRVRLLSGVWMVNGRTVAAPAEALACRTVLAGESGEVEFSPGDRTGKIAMEWTSAPLPVSPETVIGLDIGTTTIAAVKVRHGEVIGAASCFNRQSCYGDNVVSRINAAAGDLNGLREAVLDSCREVLDELGTDGVARLAIAGNTVMSCLFHGIDPASIGVMPFTPPVRRFPECTGVFGKIPVLTVPSIAGYVGGDLTAGLYETGLQADEMLVDIGTNCEIIFHTPFGLFCTAAAAGPAFEGAGLRFGVRAAAGAIDHYFGERQFTVLGEVEPRGLCGSAFIDFLAVERRLGHLNGFGRYQPKANSMAVTGDILIDESDIEQLLKAKAAVWAGIKTLEDHCGLEARRIYLAGGFAQYLDLPNAIAVGMLPEREYRIVGNTSLAGAARLAVRPELLVELERLSDLPEEIPLNTLSEFEDNFIDGLLFP